MSALPAAILASIDDLPSLPTSVIEVLRLLDNPETSARQVAAAIGRDPVLTARVLRLANSAWYTWSRRISAIPDAVVLVGYAGIRSQVIGSAAYDVLRIGAPGYAFEQSNLWQHSVAVAATARQLTKRSRLGAEEAAFAAGLLHDIGKVVLGKSFGPRYPDVALEVERGVDFIEAERNILGCDHAQVGAEAARRWNLPEALVQAIEYHHRPLELDTPGLADVVYLAETLSMTLGVGMTSDQPITQAHDVLARVRLAPSDVTDLLDTLMAMLVGSDQPLDAAAGAPGQRV